MYLIFLFIHLIYFIMSIFGSFKSVPAASRQLGEGVWPVRIILAEETNSFLNADGTPRIAERLWTNPTKQVMIKLFCPDNNLYFTHWMSMESFRKAETLTKAEIKEGKLAIAGIYVIDKKTKVRIPDGIVEPETGKPTPGSGLEKCWSITNDLFTALGLPESSDDLAPAIASKTLMSVKIVKVPYNETEPLKVTKFFAYKEKTVGADFEG